MDYYLKSTMWWNNINFLTNLSSLLFWISIVMLFMGILIQIGTHYINKRIDNIKEKNEQEIEIHRKKEFENITKKTDPYAQSIQSASAFAYFITESNDKEPTFFRDEGAFISFLRGNEEILIFKTAECRSIPYSPGKLKYEGDFNLELNHSSVGQKLTILRDVEYIKINFLPIEKNYEVIGGEVICIFNGNVRVEFKIPHQKMQDKLIFIRNISYPY